jgi:hypothetical protein
MSLPSRFVSRFAVAPPRARALLAAGAAAAALLLALSGDPLVSGAGRGSLVVLALGGAARYVRRGGGVAAPSPEMALVERLPLSRDAAVALLSVRGRAILVGYGSDGVRLLADLDPEARP